MKNAGYNFEALLANLIQPPVKQGSFVSFTIHWKFILSPLFHISVIIVCPGNTGFANLALTAITFPGSLDANSSVTQRTAIPSVQRPCKIGRSKPPNAENCGSMCKGFKSPFNLYKAAWLMDVWYSLTTSGLRFTGEFSGKINFWD